MAQKKKFNNQVEWRSVCPICSALDVLGDKWTMLIVRDLIINGPRTYSELRESPERISTNILANRLALLTSLELVERVNPRKSARNNAYKLTKGGASLRPVLESLGKWAHRHLKQYHGDMVSVDSNEGKKVPNRNSRNNL
jgi:DNA-binding HxlR family transcriptional regulator